MISIILLFLKYLEIIINNILIKKGGKIEEYKGIKNDAFDIFNVFIIEREQEYQI